MSSKKSIIFPLLLVLYEIATYLSNDMYLPALPDMMKDLAMSTRQAQLTMTTWFIGSALLALVMGVISDRYGRRPVLLIGGIFYILSTIACALAKTSNSLLLARFIEGASIPSMMVAGYAAIHELYERKEAIRILALMSSITILAPALGPLFGSFVMSISGWREIFWLITIWSVISIVSLYYIMPETLVAEKRSAVQLITLFKQYARVITNKRFMLLIFVMGGIFAGFITWISAGPLLVIQTYKLSPISFGVIQAIVFAAYLLGNYWVKILLEKMSIHRIIWSGLSLTLLGGLLIFIFALVLPDLLIPFIIGMTIFSFGSALCFPPLNRSVVEASDEPMGIRMSMFTVLWTGFAVLGSLIASEFFNGTLQSIVYPITMAIVFSCILMCLA